MSFFIHFFIDEEESSANSWYNEHMNIFDTHTHLNDEPFKHRIADEVKKAKNFSVTKMNIVGSNLELNRCAVEIAEQFDACYATIGWHPDDAGTFDEHSQDYLLSVLTKPKVIAVGEIGLDYHWMVESKAVQEQVFRRQIEISKQLNLPFQVHSRDALKETYHIIKSEGVGSAGAIMHSFSGTYEEAKKFLDLGMMLSFSGVVTFKKAVAEQEAVSKLPLDRILVETDAPYLTPVPYRGRENTPAYTRYVVEKIAELRGLPIETVAEKTYENAMRIFKIE